MAYQKKLEFLKDNADRLRNLSSMALIRAKQHQLYSEKISDRQITTVFGYKLGGVISKFGTGIIFNDGFVNKLADEAIEYCHKLLNETEREEEYAKKSALRTELNDKEMFELKLVGLTFPENTRFSIDDMLKILPKSITRDKEEYTLALNIDTDWQDRECYDVAYKNKNRESIYFHSHHYTHLIAVFKMLKTLLSEKPELFGIKDRSIPTVYIPNKEWKMSPDKCIEIIDYLDSYELLFLPGKLITDAEFYYATAMNEEKETSVMILEPIWEPMIKKHIESLYDASIKPIKRQIPIVKENYQKTYLMHDANTGYTKIGRSVNPRQRERTLQSEKPTITLFKICDKDVESVLHVKYAHKRIRGEWFDLSEDDITEITNKYNFQEVK